MREIKFKAWDKENKVMRNVTCIQWVDGKIESIALDREEITNKIENFEILEFTGLLDKNDKEIL